MIGVRTNSIVNFIGSIVNCVLSVGIVNDMKIKRLVHRGVEYHILSGKFFP